MIPICQLEILCQGISKETTFFCFVCWVDESGPFAIVISLAAVLVVDWFMVAEVDGIVEVVLQDYKPM